MHKGAEVCRGVYGDAEGARGHRMCKGTGCIGAQGGTEGAGSTRRVHGQGRRGRGGTNHHKMRTWAQRQRVHKGA